MAKEMAKLPRIMRSPIDMLDMSTELLELADMVEKQAAEEGRAVRMRPRLLRIRSFARELEESATAKLGNHEKHLKG